METAGTEWIRAGMTAEVFRAPEDAAGRMITGDRMIIGGRGAMMGPTAGDEVLVADRFLAVF